MKKAIITFAVALVALGSAIGLAACKTKCKDIELMGAGDRLHDSYTFANNGVILTDKGDNKYEISGSVDYVSDTELKEEFNINEDINHVIAIKLSNCGSDQLIADQVVINIDGVRNFDAEHLNGSNYTFIILEAKVGATTTISVKWNSSMDYKVYTITMANDLKLNAES